jgi:hypothetical protein
MDEDESEVVSEGCFFCLEFRGTNQHNARCPETASPNNRDTARMDCARGMRDAVFHPRRRNPPESNGSVYYRFGWERGKKRL